jgi:diguanylate cyclase (GGDEF)-like protein
MTLIEINQEVRKLTGEIFVAIVPLSYCLLKIQFNKREIFPLKEINFVKFSISIILIAHIIVMCRISNLFGLSEDGLSVSSDYSLIILLSGHLSSLVALLMIINSQKEKLLTELADKDGLTNLLNRRAFIAKLKSKKAIQGAILICDADHFKNINDTYGHVVGDKVLIHIANVIRSSTSDSDLLARYGGEEFLAFFSNINTDEAVAIAERIRKTLEKSPVKNGDNTIQVTISVGVTIHEGGPIESTIDAADKNLYSAKRMGRNKTCF